MRAAGLTFGGRVLCPFLRPNFVSPMLYDEVRAVCAAIFRAVERAEERLGRELWERVDLTEPESRLAAIHPGFRRSSPTARLAASLTRRPYHFLELTAAAPA